MDGTGELFQPFVDAMPADSEVSVVSYPPDRTLSFEELLAHVREAVPAGPYVLVAESFSGPLAVALAASCPSNLRAVVLCATFVANPLPWPLRWLRHVPSRFAFTLTPPKWFVRALLTGSDGDVQLVDAVIAATKLAKPAIMSHRLAQVLHIDVAGLLASVQVPVLYLAGSRDRLVGLRGLKQVSRQLPGLRSVVLDGPHLLLQCRPEQAVREILNFLAAQALRDEQAPADRATLDR